ncbi:hypothetical protein LWI29_004203 [Acer saccharum]|uniref:ubiquitinyl hydrolase 1 n=1 Tax=Acer saccharum TaxID=4024 RepID=A0AA39T2I8_ACESA|nr:hypothetical protein LWI29_004203 [Acer saccharum]
MRRVRSRILEELIVRRDGVAALAMMTMHRRVDVACILNEIAEKLVLDDPDKQTWTPLSVVFKPHHNSLTGNYDINVLIVALEGRRKAVVWQDRRNEAVSIDLDGGDSSTLMGIVINIPVTRSAGIWKGRHWITLQQIVGVWYNLDSDFKSP